MDDGTYSGLPAGLLRAQQKIEQWRQRHRPRSRLPEELWQQAAKLACLHGINRTARALRLDYYTLKEHAAAAAEGSGDPAAGFMEVLAPAMPAAECTIELEDRDGAKMRIHLQGGNVPDVSALARAFRESR